MHKLKEHIETLIAKAAKAGNAPEAMQYAQAAANAGNALPVVEAFDRRETQKVEDIERMLPGLLAEVVEHFPALKPQADEALNKWRAFAEGWAR